jgi:hypothetical protein
MERPNLSEGDLVDHDDVRFDREACSLRSETPFLQNIYSHY